LELGVRPRIASVPERRSKGINIVVAHVRRVEPVEAAWVPIVVFTRLQSYEDRDDRDPPKKRIGTSLNYLVSKSSFGICDIARKLPG